MSTLRVTTISNAGGTKTVPADTVVDGTAKAWVRFNGTGTVAINAAFNVTSITDNGVGLYTVNFTNAMVDANYSFQICAALGGGVVGVPTTTSCGCQTWNAAFTNADRDIITVTINR